MNIYKKNPGLAAGNYGVAKITEQTRQGFKGFSIRYRKHLLFILYGLVTIEVIRIMANTGKISMGESTYLFASIEYLSLLIFSKIALDSRLERDVPFNIRTAYLIWLLINITSLLRGVVLTSGYWDYKFLFLTAFSFSAISLAFFVGTNHKYFIYIYREFILRVTVVALIVALFLYSYNHEIFPRIVIPVTFFLCLLPYVDRSTRIKLLVITGLSLFLEIGFRTNIIKIVLVLLVLCSYFLKNRIGINPYRLAHKILFFVPVVLLLLGLTGMFNLFSYVSDIDIGSSTTISGRQASFTGDTRTFLYREVISSVEQSGNWLLGESSCGSYRSISFFNTGGAMNGRRYGSEVGILNIFLYHGVLGVAAYFFLLYIVSSMAITRSNNDLAKMFGVLIASRWSLSFVEEFTRFDMNFFFFWLILGFVSTNSFRSLSDRQVVSLFMIRRDKTSAFNKFQTKLFHRL